MVIRMKFLLLLSFSLQYSQNKLMKLIITEKPSVARTIAEYFEPDGLEKGNGYIKGKKYIYSWAIGHLVQLADATNYCDDVWNINNIPIIPNNFELKENPKTKDQLAVLKHLISQSEEIINATDCAREGELIFRYILDIIGNVTVPVKRLWISSYTDSSIQKGFDNLKPSSDYDNLYYSGRSRARADWLFGINATIAITKTINNGELYSLGRVQTPTFALICKRFLEHKTFKKTTFYIPTLLLENQTIIFKSSYMYEDYILKEDQANAILNSIGKTIVCQTADNINKKYVAPLCFDLTSLQMKANTLFGFTASKTLKLAQTLYEKHKALSYPRTDSKYLSNQQIDDVQTLLNGFKNNNVKFKCISDNISNSRNFNDSKIADHHAIIPTSSQQDTSLWTKDEVTLYDLVINQFIMSFSKEASAQSITYSFSSGSHTFKSSSLNYTDLGWKILEKNNEELPNDEDLKNNLPILNVGDIVNITKKEIQKSTTQPKPIFTDATLLGAMESAGKDFEVEDLPTEIKRKGIGTPATRANILEKIIKRSFVLRKGKQLIPSEFGLKFYDAIKYFDIADVKLTGKWEEKLYELEENDVTENDFMSIVISDLNNVVIPNIKSVERSKFLITTNTCPKCQSALNNSPKALSCSNTSNCKFILWKTFFNIKLSNNQLDDLLSLKAIGLKKIIANKEKPAFDCKVILSKEKDFALSFLFTDNKTDLTCPKCKTHKLHDKGSYLKCNNEVCDLTISKIIAKKTLSDNLIKELVENQKTKLISGFKGKSGKPFNAALQLNFKEKYPVQFLFQNKK